MKSNSEEEEESDFDSQFENLDDNPDDDLHIKFIKKVIRNNLLPENVKYANTQNLIELIDENEKL